MSDKLNKNKFVKELSDKNALLIQVMSKRKDFLSDVIEGSGKARKDLTNKQDFLVTTFQLMMEVMNKYEKLDYAEVFIKSYPKTKSWDKVMVRSDYIIYHLEVYYQNIVGLFDRCLILTNQVYGLGIQTRHIKLDTIAGNKHLEGTDTQKVLKEFDRSIKRIRSVRNYISHESSLDEDGLKDVKTFEFLIDSNRKLGDEGFSKQAEVFIKLEYSKFIRRKKREIKTNNEALEYILDKFFKTLNKPYSRTLKNVVD